METTYLILVIILFILAISDLVVGVSNDAVNFLNSAIGAKVARHTVVMVIATLGVFVGATFSDGMMEVARKGIYHPEFFTFSEVMVIYLAVMLTDIILLDGFNRLGFPTSTTVSIVFEILGAAIAMSVIKMYNSPDALTLGEYINSSKALAIIGGIFLSVVVSFTVGALIQWLVRYTFSFNFNMRIKYLGAIYGGLAITAITYFLLIKGIKGTPYASHVLDSGITVKEWVHNNTWTIVAISFLIWTVITQILVWLFKINILKVVVFFGTFALAMAFAGNDLVNFIGVPIAGLESYKLMLANPDVAPDMLFMDGLSGEVKTNPLLLFAAGLIMILTLWFSKKARKVIATGINLSRQSDGDERFGSSAIARGVVRSTSKFSKQVGKLTPVAIKNSIAKQFDSSDYEKNISKMKDPPAFDLLRASVNLIVASVLISFATSLKLPLSTTYVTFMVAMGTSLADRAWGRESAVFRVTGVFSVIGGWFLTAIIAMTVAFIFANIINVGGLVAVIILFCFAIFSLLRKKRKSNDDDTDETEETEEDENISDIDKYKRDITKNLFKVGDIFNENTNALVGEKHRKLRKLAKKSEEMCEKTKTQKNEVYKSAKYLDEGMLESGLFHVQTLDYLRSIAYSVDVIVSSSFYHIANNHKPLIEEQNENIQIVSEKIDEYVSMAVEILNNRDFSDLSDLTALKTEGLKLIKDSTVKQIKLMSKDNVVSTKASVLYFNFLQESQNILVQVMNVVKYQRDADKAAI